MQVAVIQKGDVPHLPKRKSVSASTCPHRHQARIMDQLLSFQVHGLSTGLVPVNPLPLGNDDGCTETMLTSLPQSYPRSTNFPLFCDEGCFEVEALSDDETLICRMHGQILRGALGTGTTSEL